MTTGHWVATFTHNVKVPESGQSVGVFEHWVATSEHCVTAPVAGQSVGALEQTVTVAGQVV